MKGGIPFVLKRNADRSRFYRLVLHLQKSISGTAKTFKLLWLCPDSLFNRSASTDSRFGSAESFYRRAEEITGNKPMMTISEAEPIGPKNLFDALVILPCTGNTLAKLANGNHRHTCFNGGKSPFTQQQTASFIFIDKRRPRYEYEKYRTSFKYEKYLLCSVRAG